MKLFGAAMTVGIALITQMGEQVDYLRFMPERIDDDRAGNGARRNKLRWWAGVLIGGPGWVVLGVVKMLGGALLAYLAISLSVPADRAVDPNQMYLAAYEYVFPHYGWAVAATAIFVVDLAVEDQRDERVRRLARVVELLRTAHAQPPGPRRVGRCSTR